MNYYKYNTIYNYMLSDWATNYPVFNNVRVFLTNSGSYDTFTPTNLCYISEKENTKYFLNSTKGINGVTYNEFVMNDKKLRNTELVTDADVTGEDTSDVCYEQIFNTPARRLASKCPFIDSYKGKARREAIAQGEDKLSDEEATKAAFAWKTEFDEDEYNKLSIPTTQLNQSTVCFKSDVSTVSAKEKFLANGALIANKIGDNLFPIYYVDFETPSYYNQYVFDWNENGVFRAK